jgi:transposase
VPVNVLADDAPPPADALEVALGDGRVVRVRPGFDAATLRRLLAVLREGRPC